MDLNHYCYQPMKIIDLSKTIEYNKQDPWFMRIKIKHKSHKQSRMLIRFFLGLPARLFPKGFQGWADDKITGMGVHAATHIDAPWHYSPVVNGQPAKTIDEVPLEWCYGPGVVLNMTHKADLEEITVTDIQKDLEKSGAVITPGTIVLIYTGRDQYIGTSEYPMRGTGMSAEATHWLIDQGVKVMGIDQWGFDLPLKYMAQAARKNNKADYFWQAHLVGQEKEYCHMEQLVNLGALPSSGFKVAVFPLKIKGGSAAPARVVAIFE
ncbi:MAG TPA: cyclase family protein [Chitinophaga sp.]|uniref:cyclase family protein n=1 Tax=Chitinophaga sp. TaxID=1869181 RepID=UPI002CAECD3E|nr:cyclase family protein [Chitinophaga sp.]HVI44708.1 cyclase family protein [Chitinophaga sp.]